MAGMAFAKVTDRLPFTNLFHFTLIRTGVAGVWRLEMAEDWVGVYSVSRSRDHKRY